MNETNIYPVTYNKNHYCVMANDIIRGKSEMSLQEARLIRLLITQVAKEDKDLKTYTCRIQDLAKFLGISQSNMYRDIYTICDNLLTCLVRIGTGNPREPWLKYQWVSMANYDGNGTVTLKLSEQTSRYVLELSEWFTQYRLDNILEFNSYYAIRLYELLKCDIGVSQDRKVYFEYSIDELRLFFSCENKYKETKDFNKRVIEISVREINAKADIDVYIEYCKTGKSITSVRFYFMYLKLYLGTVYWKDVEDKFTLTQTKGQLTLSIDEVLPNE